MIGRTSKEVMVQFDTEFLAGTSLNSMCKTYTGALVDYKYLMNVTQKFRKTKTVDKNSWVN